MKSWVSLGLTSVCVLAGQQAQAQTTEDDYFANVPVVLTASRLDQPLNEAPGALTVIDRQAIRQSGARTMADVLRLVPGYFSGGWNGANPTAVYHIPLDDYGTRNLVLIDGLPVYSSGYLGDTHRGMMDVMLEDIERIEVLRGSNSAAYGANAMFGVINIITRHSGDTVGGELAASVGSNGIADRRVRVGMGNDTASVRLSMGEQRDQGYANAYDDKWLRQANLRADFKPNQVDDIMVTAGVSYLSAGEGFADENGNPLHTVDSKDTSLNTRWRRQLSDTDELQVTFNYMEDWRRDATPYPPLPAVILDFGGEGRRTNLEVQRKAGLSDTVRAVIGVGYKEEGAKSQALYARPDWITFHEERLFGTVEWRMTPQWLLNTGLFLGQQSITGLYKAPRVMVNWMPSAQHTFRAGVTDSVRAPTLSEYAGDVRYYLNGTLIARTVAARGNVQPEKLHSQEVGYLGRFPDEHVTVDVRAYHERMDSLISTEIYTTATSLPVTGNTLTDYANKAGFDLTGVEYQVRWKPADTSEIWVNQAFSHLDWNDPDKAVRDERRPPWHTTTIAWFQQLPKEWRLSVLHQRIGGMTWRDNRDWLTPSHRTDLRLAYPFRLGSTKCEAAVTIQQMEGLQPFFLIRKNFEVDRKSFVSLRMEF